MTHTRENAPFQQKKKKKKLHTVSPFTSVFFILLNINYIFYVQVYHVLYNHAHTERNTHKQHRPADNKSVVRRQKRRKSVQCTRTIVVTLLANSRTRFRRRTRRQRAGQYTSVSDVIGIGCRVLGNVRKPLTRTVTKMRRNDAS